MLYGISIGAYTKNDAAGFLTSKQRRNMKLEPGRIAEISEKFHGLNSRREFLSLLNEVKKLLYEEKTQPFKLRQLTWYGSPKLRVERYKEFSIKKKSGTERKIHSPVKGLKTIQRCLSVILECVYEPHPAAMGFVTGRSIVDNAALHTGNRYVYNIDLKDFFPSVDQARVWKCLQLEPFNLVRREPESDVIRASLNPINLLNLSEHVKVSIPERKASVIFSEVKGGLRTGRHSFHLVTGEKVNYSIRKTSGEDCMTATIGIEKEVMDAAEKMTSSVIKGKIPNIRKVRIATLITHALVHQRKIFGKDNRGSLANLIASLCCTEMEVERMDEKGEWTKVRKNVLPQGAPTSPILTNIVCRKLDHRLNGVAKRFGLRYSRYADDITFSSMHNVYHEGGDFVKEITRVITEQGFHIKESKTRLQKDGHRKEVTGLLVNEKANVSKRYVKQLRMWLYYWERYGYDKASILFTMDYIRDKGHVKSKRVNMINVIEGKLRFLRMVKGVEDRTFSSLYERFLFLSENKFEIDAILETWENEGIEKAIKLFSSPTQ
jgi:retron-type reverse transcriptase